MSEITEISDRTDQIQLSKAVCVDDKGNSDLDHSGWESIPDYLLENILDSVPIKVRLRAGQTCRSWYTVFISPRSWRSFVYRDLMFTRLRHTFQGLQYAIDHYRLRFLVSNKARLWHNLIFKTTTSDANTNRLFNLYEFMRVLTNFTEYYEHRDDRPLEELRSFEFNWNLHIHTSGTKEHPQAYGTGGQLLRGLSHLLSHLHGLETLSVRQLLLDSKEAEDFMGDLLNNFGPRLKTLCIRNLTKLPHSLIHFGLYLNLRKLVVSPQHLNDDSTFLISSNECMRDLVIVQDENTKLANAVSEPAWIQLRKNAPKVKVHLHCAGLCQEEMLWQPMAPVFSIVYDNPSARLTCQAAAFIVDNYSDTLRVYVQKGVQRRFRSRSFHDRADTAFIYMVRSCRCLSLVAVRERVSTASLLLIVQLTSYKPFQLLIRRNAVLKRADWPFNPNEWSWEFYCWLKRTARDYDLVENEIRRLYGNGNWRMMQDSEYIHAFKSQFL